LTKVKKETDKCGKYFPDGFSIKVLVGSVNTLGINYWICLKEKGVDK
jgi:hypothetical protein